MRSDFSRRNNAHAHWYGILEAYTNRNTPGHTLMAHPLHNEFFKHQANQKTTEPFFINSLLIKGGFTMLQKMTRTNEKGFTLIELMIVIAIIGILAAIAIPNFIAYRNKAFLQRRRI